VPPPQNLGRNLAFATWVHFSFFHVSSSYLRNCELESAPFPPRGCVFLGGWTEARPAAGFDLARCSVGPLRGRRPSGPAGNGLCGVKRPGRLTTRPMPAVWLGFKNGN